MGSNTRENESVPERLAAMEALERAHEALERVQAMAERGASVREGHAIMEDVIEIGRALRAAALLRAPRETPDNG